MNKLKKYIENNPETDNTKALALAEAELKVRLSDKRVFGNINKSMLKADKMAKEALK